MGKQELKPKYRSLAFYLVLLAGAVAAMTAVRQCSAPRLEQRIDLPAGGDTLNVAIEVSPICVSFSGDTLSGPYYDMIVQAAGEMNRPLKFHPFTRLSDALEWLRDNRCRLVVADIPITADLRRQYRFIEASDVDRLVLVQRADSAGEVSVYTQTDLAGHTVWVPKGSPARMRLHNLAHEIGDTIIVREDPDYGAEQLAMLVYIGELEGGLTVMSRDQAEMSRRRYPDLDASVEISLNQYRGWAMMPRDSLLMDSISAALKRHPS